MHGHIRPRKGGGGTLCAEESIQGKIFVRGIRFVDIYRNLCCISEDTKAIDGRRPKKDTSDQWLGQLIKTWQSDQVVCMKW